MSQDEIFRLNRLYILSKCNGVAQLAALALLTVVMVYVEHVRVEARLVNDQLLDLTAVVNSVIDHNP